MLEVSKKNKIVMGRMTDDNFDKSAITPTL